MLGFFKRKYLKHKAKRVFQEYGYEIVNFQLEGIGNVQYAQWLNPLERRKEISLDKVDFFRRFVKPGTIAIDIGAHTGDTPIPMALAAGVNGKVLAFEPNPYVFKILQANAELNKDKTTIVPINSAVTVEDGDFYYSSSEASFNNGGISAAEPDKHGKFHMASKVKGLNLERYLNAHYPGNAVNVSLIKVDTEGYDLHILKSIDNVIRRFRPALIFECFGKLTKTEREDLYDLISRLGYTLYYFSDFVSNAEVQMIKKEDMMRWKHFDIYALPTD